MHAHTLTQARALGGCLAFKPLVGGGGGFAFVTHFSGGGLRTTLGGGGGGLDSGVWEGVLFFVSQVVFSWILMMLMMKCNFEVAGMPCNGVHHTTPHDTRPHHMTLQHTTAHPIRPQHNTPRHCTIQHTTADHTPQQWCGVLTCGLL